MGTVIWYCAMCVCYHEKFFLFCFLLYWKRKVDKRDVMCLNGTGGSIAMVHVLDIKAKGN